MRKTNLIFFLILFICALPLIAQDTLAPKASPFNPGVDLVSRYVWRGQLIDRSPNIQPWVEYAPAFGLRVGAWGSYSFGGDYAEVDLYLGYGYKGFSLMLTDYFVMDESLENNHFFDYRKGITGHLLEGTLAWEGTEKVPLKLTAATMFYGADMKVDHVVIDTSLNDTTAYYINQYSTYFEAAWSFRYISIFAGITPAAGFYGKGFGLVNLGLTADREIRLGKNYSVGLRASLITNPQRQNIYLVLGISL
jgi:hypothetical protein